MIQRTQFHKVLPVSQTALAILFGGWGLWVRVSMLNRSFLGWGSTAEFHLWPWPFKFAAILTMPAFIVGTLLSWPLGYLLPRLPDWVPIVLFIPLLWYWVGSWVDQHLSRKQGWTMLLLFIVICAGAASIPKRVGGYAGYVLFGIEIWLVVAIAMKATTTLRKRRAKLS